MTISLNNKSKSKLANKDQATIGKTQDAKKIETDTEMLIRISKKFAIIFVVILMLDSILDLLAGLLDLMTGLLHLVIEFFEYSFEVLLEYIFNTHHHESEIILANIAILLLIFLFIKFCLKTPNLLIIIKKNIQSTCLEYRHRQACHWQSLTLEKKIKTGAVYSLGIFSVLFFLTL
jgi:hypothetical protein